MAFPLFFCSQKCSAARMVDLAYSILFCCLLGVEGKSRGTNIVQNAFAAVWFLRVADAASMENEEI